MRKKQHTPEQIIAKLREAEVALSQGNTVPEVCRNLGVTELKNSMAPENSADAAPRLRRLPWLNRGGRNR